MDHKLLEKVKSNLRAVVQSSAECIFVHQVAYQYKEIMGEDLPFRRLGFSTARDLIRSLNDAVYIQRELAGEIVLNVSDRTTAHIDEFVRTQKVNTKPRSRSGYRPPKLLRKQVESSLAPIQKPRLTNFNTLGPNSANRSGNFQPASSNSLRSQGYGQPMPQPVFKNRSPSSPLLPNPPLIHNPPSFNVHIPPPLMHIQPPFIQNPPHVFDCKPPIDQPLQKNQTVDNWDAEILSEALKQRVGEVCKQFRSGVPFLTIKALYAHKFHEELVPGRFGFSNWMDFIEAMPDVVHIKKVGGDFLIFPSTKSETLQCNEISSSSPPNQSVTPSTFIADKVTSNNSFKCESELDMSISNASVWNDSDVGEERSNRWTDVQSSVGDFEDTRSVTSRNESLPARRITPEKIRYDRRRSEWLESQSAAFDSTKSKSSRLKSDIKSAMKTTIYQYPDGLPLHDLLKAYQKHTGQTLTLAELGYVHILQLVIEFSDIMHAGNKAGEVDIIFPGPARNRWRETYIPSPEPKKKEQGNFNKSDMEHIHLIQEMLAIVCSHQQMLKIDDFVKLYQEEFQRSFMLNGTNLRPVAIIEKFSEYFVLNFFDDLVISATQKGKNLYEAMIAEDKNLKLKIAKIKEPIVGKIPPDAVLTVSKEIAQYPLPEDFKIGNVYQIHISSAEDPTKFRFQFEHAQEELEKFNEEMNDFYNDESVSKEYMSRLDLLLPGMICVVLVDELLGWNRGLISHICGGDVSMVLFDYGNSVTLPHSKIRFIKKEFLIAPAFCYQACLHGITATFKGVWSTEASQKFYNLSKVNDTLDAKFLTAERPYQLILYINENGKRESIADILIKCNHAKSSVLENRELLSTPSRLESVSLGIHRPLSKSSSICSSIDERYSATNSESQLRSTNKCSDTCRIIGRTIYGKVFRVVNLEKSFYLLAQEVSQSFRHMEIVKILLALDNNCCIVRKSENYVMFKKIQSECGITDDCDIRLVEISKVNDVIKEVVKYYAEFSEKFEEFVDLMTIRN